MPKKLKPIYMESTMIEPVHTAQEIRKQAERVAWRQLLRWIQAQIAMIDVGMVEAREVFLPYRVEVSTGKTFFQLAEAQYKLLPAGEGAK